MDSDNKINKTRLSMLVLFVVLFWVVLQANLFRIQILNHEKFDRVAYRQYEKRITIPARRGSICDRNGHPLAISTIHYDIAADPKMVKNKKKAAARLARTFGKSESYFLKKLNQNSHFVYLERKAGRKQMEKILALNDPGIIKLENFRRDYSYGTDAGQLLGFTDPDDRGLSGLELQFENELSGEMGEAVLQYDGPRRVFYNADYPIRPAIAGQDVILTIDKNIQTIVEDELELGVKNAKAASGIVVVMDPNNGAILAMANYPKFNPNKQRKYKTDLKRNRAVTDVFEPGSTLKIFTAATLLQERLKKTDDIVYCENGRYQVYDRYFTDTKKYGWLSFRRVIENSSNVGMIKLSAGLHPNLFFRYLRSFGFGEKTFAELPGEAEGFLEQPNAWSGVSKASISIGYEIGTTALQLTAAFGAIVNGGYLYRPHIVSHIQAADGQLIHETEPEMIRQILSSEVSDILKGMMRGVVENGTGIKAGLKQISAGGKTGTARKFDHKKKRYYHDRYLGSFVGFASYENPKYVCAVFIDEPKKGYYGGQVAAPVFNKIMYRIFNLQDSPLRAPIAESDNSTGRIVEPIADLPELTGFEIDAARALLDKKNIDYLVKGDGKYIKDMYKEDGELVVKTGRMELKSSRTPRLIGLTLREAVNRVNLEKFKIVLDGQRSGVVKKQSIKPGVEVRNRTALTLSLAD